MKTDEEENDRLQEKLEKAAESLGEHFESLLIIATNSGGNGASRHGIIYQASSGSVFASTAAAQSYLNKREGFDQAAGFDEYAETVEGDEDED